MNTCKARKLTDSKYNERRAECEHALSELKQELPIGHLCEIIVKQFEENQHLVTKENERRRVRHVVYENTRVFQAYALLQKRG